MQEKKLDKETIKEGWYFYKYFAKYLKPYWKKYVLIIILSQLVVYLGMINPYLTKLVIDKAYAERNLSLFIQLSITIGLLFLIKTFLGNISSYIKSKVNKKLNFDINKDVVSHIYSLDLNFFKNSSSGDNVYKVNQDINRITDLITGTVLQLLNVIPTFFVTLVIVYFLNWQMGLMAFSLGFIFYLHTKFFAHRRRSILRKIIKQQQKVFRKLVESFSMIYLIKATNKEKDERNAHIKRLGEVVKRFLDSMKLQIASSYSASILNKMILGGITFYGGYNIITGQMTLGTLTAILLYLGRLVNFPKTVFGIMQKIYINVISCERIKDILEKKPETFGTKKPKQIDNIQLKNVNFYYEKDNYILKDFSIKISPGQTIGLVGFSGVGKTTILNLILGLYKPISGKVLISDIPHNKVNFEIVRKSAGIVPQKPELWNATLRENITYLHRANDNEIKEVLKKVDMDNFISDKSLNVNVGESGCKLSEGQKQRIALARALLRKPKLLILDEAFSFVDNGTINKIINNLMKKDMTILVITHNPKILEKTDKVYFMKNKNKTISGQHREIIKYKEYKEIFDINQHKDKK